MEKLTGETVQILVNQKVDTIIELKHGNIELINADTSQNKLFNNGMEFFWLGSITLISAVAFFISGLKMFIKLKKEKQEYLSN